MEWLLEEDQPSVRYYALVDLLGRGSSDPDVKESLSLIPKKGWAADILRKQKAGGYWVAKESLYRPKYIATNWMALILSDLGLTRENGKVRKTAELFLNEWMDLTKESIFTDEVCIVGNTARMLARFGYADDSRVARLFDRLVEDQKEDGGWHCFKSSTGTLDCWEALAAFAALPKSNRTKRISNAVERGAEFYLERKLFDDGEKRYQPWFRFHYPNHYYYDILVGLDVLTSLGYAGDARLRPALDILDERRQPQGAWLLDKVHPDVGPGAKYHRGRKWVPFALEEPGKPSKWITLRALSVLKRVADAD